jgi:hypothetical protein
VWGPEHTSPTEDEVMHDDEEGVTSNEASASSMPDLSNVPLLVRRFPATLRSQTSPMVNAVAGPSGPTSSHPTSSGPIALTTQTQGD